LVRLRRGLFFFFFSSRRRHTRLVSDWSSDVCSSDLGCDGGLYESFELPVPGAVEALVQPTIASNKIVIGVLWVDVDAMVVNVLRSEERRVGKESRAWRWA